MAIAVDFIRDLRALAATPPVSPITPGELRELVKERVRFQPGRPRPLLKDVLTSELSRRIAEGKLKGPSLKALTKQAIPRERLWLHDKEATCWY